MMTDDNKWVSMKNFIELANDVAIQNCKTAIR